MPIAKPVADSNAIEAAAFVIQFEREFSESEIEALFALAQRLKQDLPSFQKLITLLVGVSEEGASSVATAPFPRQRLAGILLQHFRDNGKPDWVLRASNNQVAA